MTRFELEDRSGNFICGLESSDALQRVLRFMRANDEDADLKLIIWGRDAEGEPFPIDPTTVA